MEEMIEIKNHLSQTWPISAAFLLTGLSIPCSHPRVSLPSLLLFEHLPSDAYIFQFPSRAIPDPPWPSNFRSIASGNFPSPRQDFSLAPRSLPGIPFLSVLHP